MNTNMIDTKDVILALKRVKKDKKLSIDKIYELVKEKDFSTSVSRTTVARVFKKNSENQTFRYEATLRPIANALLDMEEIEESDNNSTQAYKSILKLKQEIITELEDKLKNIESANTDVSHYIKSIELLNTQLAFKDKRIDQLLDANDRLQKTIDKLTDQLLTCPCRKSGGIQHED